MSEKYKTYPGGLFFVTLTVVGWIDVFTRREYADEIIKNLNYCIQHKGLKIYAFCIMPSHIHMVVYSEGSLSDILRDFKVIPLNKSSTKLRAILRKAEKTGFYIYLNISENTTSTMRNINFGSSIITLSI
jgi:REP element-mobilizing transposase RayT